MTTLNREQKVEKILNLVRKMEQNTFLMPNSWSELYQMATRTAHYKTYVGGRGDCGRYINIEYTRNDEIYNPKQTDSFVIEIRKNEVYIAKRLGDSSNFEYFSIGTRRPTNLHRGKWRFFRVFATRFWL